MLVFAKNVNLRFEGAYLNGQFDVKITNKTKKYCE
jgi:hypothetical protein